MHLHRNEEEHFVVLVGTYRILIEDKVLDTSVGASVTVPRVSRHSRRNISNETSRLVVILTPGGPLSIAAGWMDVSRSFTNVRLRQDRTVLQLPGPTPYKCHRFGNKQIHRGVLLTMQARILHRILRCKSIELTRVLL